MQRGGFLLVSVLMVACLPCSAGQKTAVEKPSADKAKEASFVLSAEEKTLLELTNKEREKQGLAPLKVNEKLFQAARAHSANMAKQERLEHTLDEKGLGERLADIGYRHVGGGENIAAGQGKPAEAMDSWMNSKGHRANILNERFTEVGLGIVASANGTRYWTQVFATPRGR